MTRILPKVNAQLKELINEVKGVVSDLKESGLDLSESKSIGPTIDEIMAIPDVIMEIMTSLQAQDAVLQCISHIEESIKITREFVEETNVGTDGADRFKLLKFLKIMPALLKAQLENIYARMNDNLCYIPVKFKGIFSTLRPPITFEELLEGKTEQTVMMDLHAELIKITSEVDEVSDEVKAEIKRSVEIILDLDEKVPEITNDIDVATSVPRKLEQPLAELLFLNHSLEVASQSAEKLLAEQYDGNPDDLDCKDKLREIAGLFSTKGEIEIARSIITDIDIEESGEEGGLVLF
jgi:hypothetical protein